MYRHIKSGKREDLGIYVRSKVEANIARYLSFLGLEWEYEPETFEFEQIKRGSRFYTPDFKAWPPDHPEDYRWIEAKGRLDQPSRTKLKRFRRYYPEEFQRLFLVVPSYRSEAARFAVEELELPLSRLILYDQLARRLKGVIPEWE